MRIIEYRSFDYSFVKTVYVYERNKEDYIQLKNGKMNGRKSAKALTVDNNVKDDIIDIKAENDRKELAKAISDGKITTKLNKKAQQAHKPGSQAFIKRVSEGRIPSYTNLSNMEVQKIINEHSLKGHVRKSKDGQFKEVIELEQELGSFGDRQNNKYVSTNRGTIHYSKDGTHLVPAPPLKGEKNNG